MEEKKKYHYLRDGKKVVLTESDLKMMVKNCVRKVLSESEQRYNVGKIGKWNRIPSNGYEFHKIPGKGTCVGIMMYVDSTSEMEIPPTYCLFRRGGTTENISMQQSLPHQKMALKQLNFR